MSVSFDLPAEVRNDMGKGASRRLRRMHKVPAILYGAHQEPAPLMVPGNILLQHLEREAFYTSIINVQIGDRLEKAVLKDLQRHPSKPFILHLDLQRISDTDKLRMHVPLHFVGEDVAPGVKQAGGRITHNVIEVDVSCLAKDLPEYIEVDLSNLNVGESIHLSDIPLPAGVELMELIHGSGRDELVAAVQAKKADEEPEDNEE